MQWAEQLKEEYSKIAKRNIEATQFGSSASQNSAKAEKIRTDDKVSQDVGLGSRDTYRKAKYIYENGNNELIQQLDDEQLSINKIIVLIKHYV